jgi:hypothetical protein
MRKNEAHHFWEGEFYPEQVKPEKNSVEGNFIDSYQKIIEQSNDEVPDFNPFEKIEAEKQKRILLVRRVLPYAAIVLLVLGSVFIFKKLQNKKSNNLYTRQELAEIEKNTTMALLHFSKELNACMTQFEDAKQMQYPADEIRQLKNVKIQTTNPFKDFKIN